MSADDERDEREWAGMTDHIDEPRRDPGRCWRPDRTFRREPCRGPVVGGSCTKCGRPAREVRS